MWIGELNCFTHEILNAEQNPFKFFRFMYMLLTYLKKPSNMQKYVQVCAKTEWVTMNKTKGK